MSAFLWPPREAWRREIIPTPSLAPDEVLIYVMATGINYNNVWAALGKPLDVIAEVRTGDVVLVPHGWHGPAVASPDADLYYLNVMAGPKRTWRFNTEPAHRWLLG